MLGISSHIIFTFICVLIVITVFAEPQYSQTYIQSNHFVSSGADDEFNAFTTPWSFLQRGDPDLTTYDIISAFNLNQYEWQKQYGVQPIVGSFDYQTAYHFNDFSNMTIAASSAFPKGMPDDFSFECTFRLPAQQPQNEWYLFELTDYRLESQMSVILNPIYKTIEFSLPRYDGIIQTVTFKDIGIFDSYWHKLMLAVTQDGVRLWVDCLPVPDRTGHWRAPLDVRGPIDTTEGMFVIARDILTHTTVPIDLQWMIFSCDVEKPTTTDCREIPKYPATPATPVYPTTPQFPNVWQPITPSTPRPPLELGFITTTPETPWQSSTPEVAWISGNSSKIDICPEVCPAGPPGPAGAPGIPGIPGPPGAPGRVESYPPRLQLPAQKGEKGERGPPGAAGRDGERGLVGLTGRDGFDGRQGPPGRPGPPGAPGVAVATDEKTVVVPGPPGPPGPQGFDGLPGVPGATGPVGSEGPPGLPGVIGIQGLQGEKGERGEIGEIGLVGLTGSPGLPGIKGDIGPAGPPGSPGVAGVAHYVNENEGRQYDDREIRQICMEVVRDYISEVATTFVGPPGPPGKRGVGRPGAPGPQGLQGEPGPRGTQGERGYPGVPGLPGADGGTGPHGPEGPKGERGNDGIGREGPPGPQGPSGIDGHGFDGLPGRPGERGETGKTGEPGTRGPPGQPGVCPDCAAYQAAYAYPLLLAQQQQSNKGPQNYYNKGPQNYYNKGP